MVTEEFLSQFRTEVQQETGPSVHKGFSEEASVCSTVVSFSVHKVWNDSKPFAVSSLSLPPSPSLVLIHPSEERSKVAAVAQRVPNSTSAGSHGATWELQILALLSFPPFNTKSFRTSPVIGTFPSTSQSSLRSRQSHKLVKGPRQKFRSLSTCSIILPGNGSCWTWSGKAQTTCDVDHPLNRPW